MTTKATALLIGGFLPALIYGGSALFQKLSTNIGISISAYLVAVGIGVGIAGIVFYFFDHASSFSFSLKAGGFAGIFGLTWGIASGLVAYSLLHLNAQIAQLVPLYNMNTLVAVILALIVFSEWQELQLVKLLLGTVLIVAGAIFVANA